MVQIVAGLKGKGKTKHLLDKANKSVQTSKGMLVYLDKNNKHMYELHSKIRLINVKEYPIESSEAFIGFVCGLLSGNRDIEEVYFDSFLNLAFLEDGNVEKTFNMLEKISTKLSVDFILSISMDKESLPEGIRQKVIVSL